MGEDPVRISYKCTRVFGVSNDPTYKLGAKSSYAKLALALVLSVVLPFKIYAQGDIVWNTEVSTTDIDTGNYGSPPTDTFTEDDVDVTIDYFFPDHPDPDPSGTTLIPDFYQTIAGTLGAQAGVLGMSMDTNSGASSGDTECTQTRFQFSPAVGDLEFLVMDVDEGSWRDLLLIRGTLGGAAVTGTGTIVDTSAAGTVVVGTAPGVTEYTCSDAETEFGTGLCFMGDGANASAASDDGNVFINFPTYIDQLEITYCESDNATNAAQFTGLGDMSWRFDGQPDYGDTPTSYGEPGHNIIDDLYIGEAPDGESGGQANADATGDNNAGSDDENGVSFTSPSATGNTIIATASVVNDIGSDAVICAWMDVWDSSGNVDGDFTDVADAAGCQTVPDNGGTATDYDFTWAGNEDASGFTYARFRLCQDEDNCDDPEFNVASITEEDDPDPDVSITDNGCPTTLDRTFTVSDSVDITDVNLSLDITHTYRGDFNITLESPTGTTVDLLTSNISIGTNNFDVIFDDDAATSIG